MIRVVSAAGVLGLCGVWSGLRLGGQGDLTHQLRSLSAFDGPAKTGSPESDRFSKTDVSPLVTTKAEVVMLSEARPMASGNQLATRQQNPTGGAFVHMGKTGGSTLSILLRNGCHSYMAHPCRTIAKHQESFASKQIESYYHVPDFGLLPQSNHHFYLITTRDPLDRLVSAFVFEHIRNKDARNETIDEYKRSKFEEAYRCFPTLQSFVDLLGSEEDEDLRFRYPYSKAMVVADSCTDLARAAFHGHVKIYNHLYFSYQKIGMLIPRVAQQTLYVTRQEHLWADWAKINEDLGQPVETIHIPAQQVVRNMTVYELQNQLPVKRDLYARGREILCRALRDEYNAYFWFLQKAKNLSPHDINQSLLYSRRNCPNVALQ